MWLQEWSKQYNLLSLGTSNLLQTAWLPVQRTFLEWSLHYHQRVEILILIPPNELQQKNFPVMFTWLLRKVWTIRKSTKLKFSGIIKKIRMSKLWVIEIGGILVTTLMDSSMLSREQTTVSRETRKTLNAFFFRTKHLY